MSSRVYVLGLMWPRFGILGGVATLAAILYVALASAWVQPVSVKVAASQHRPEAGRLFSALAIQTDNEPAGCPQGTVGHRSITPVRAAFNALSVAVCSYQIPRGTAGQELLLVGGPLGAPRKWRIIPRP